MIAVNNNEFLTVKNRGMLIKTTFIHKFLIYAFMLTLVFDPANMIFNVKIPLFILIMAYTLLTMPSKQITLSLNSSIAIFSIFFTLTVLSVLIGGVFSIDFDMGFAISKLQSMVFLGFLVIISVYKCDYVKMFSRIILLMSVVIICFALLAFSNSRDLVDALYQFGNANQSFTIQSRVYAGITVPSVYFHSSPLMVIGVTYYANELLKCINSRKNSGWENNIKKQIFKYAVFTLICISGMFLTGSRNNMFFSILSIALLIFVKSKHKARVFVVFLVLGIIVFAVFHKFILGMLNPEESSNSYKIAMIEDYAALFRQHPIIFFFGQGIGGGINITDVGIVPINELSYLDIFRWWGVPMGLAVISLMFYPLYVSIRYKLEATYHIATAYTVFLIMILLNPFFFNSVGIFFYSLTTSAVLRAKGEKFGKISFRTYRSRKNGGRIVSIGESK